MQHFLLRIVSVAALSALLTPAFADEAPPPSQEAKTVETLVIKAAALVEKEGKTAAFTEFKKKDSEWLHGDTLRILTEAVQVF